MTKPPIKERTVVVFEGTNRTSTGVNTVAVIENALLAAKRQLETEELRIAIGVVDQPIVEFAPILTYVLWADTEPNNDLLMTLLAKMSKAGARFILVASPDRCAELGSLFPAVQTMVIDIVFYREEKFFSLPGEPIQWQSLLTKLLAT